MPFRPPGEPEIVVLGPVLMAKPLLSLCLATLQRPKKERTKIVSYKRLFVAGKNVVASRVENVVTF